MVRALSLLQRTTFDKHRKPNFQLSNFRICNHISSFRCFRWRSNWFLLLFVCCCSRTCCYYYYYNYSAVATQISGLHFFQDTSTWPDHLMPNKPTWSNNPFIGWIGVTRVTDSGGILKKGMVARCYPRAPQFSRSN